MEKIDRIHRLDVLWKVWKQNFVVLNEDKLIKGNRQMSRDPINVKSLDLIMGQMFDEIKFLKEENDFLREEGKQKTKLITILTDNLLHNVKKQQIQLDNIGVEFISINNDKPSTIDKDENVYANSNNDNTSEKVDGKDEEDEIVCLFEDPFLKKEIVFLREETIQKSKLIEGLTNNLLQNTSKHEVQLNKHQTQLHQLADEFNSFIDHKNKYPAEID